MGRTKKDTDFTRRLRSLIPKEPGGQARVARESRIPPSYMSRYVNEGVIPSAQHSAAIAEATGVRTDWLITGKGQKARDTQDSIRSDVSNEERHRAAHHHTDFEATFMARLLEFIENLTTLRRLGPDVALGLLNSYNSRIRQALTMGKADHRGLTTQEMETIKAALTEETGKGSGRRKTQKP